MLRVCIVGILLLSLISFTAAADAVLNDPEIPDGEVIRYRITNGDEISYMTQTTEIQKDSEEEIYIIKNESREEKVTTKFIKNNMLQLYSHSITENDYFSTESEKVLKKKEYPGKNEIKLFDMNGLSHVLRGFPFDKPEIMTISMIIGEERREDNDDFEMKVTYLSKEKVNIRGREILCYKLELNVLLSGVFSILSFMIPKTYFWYSVEKPHYLVKYEGVDRAGGPASQIMRLELQQYSVK